MSSAKVSSEVINEVHEKLNRIYEADPGWKTRGEWPAGVSGSILHPPAAPNQIAGYEKRLGRALPPTYREFLRLHNGWEHFWGDMTLAGVSGAHTDRVLQKIDEYVRFKRDELAGVLGSSFSPADIASWEAADPRNLYLPNHIAIGTNFGGVVWLFDTRTHRSDGEMSLVYWTVDYGVWEERGLEDFPHLLEWASSMADSALKRLRDKVKKSATTGRQGKKRER